jgi:hypothetical protein
MFGKAFLMFLSWVWQKLAFVHPPPPKKKTISASSKRLTDFFLLKYVKFGIQKSIV